MRKKEKINLFQIKIPKKAMMTNSKMKMERKSKMKRFQNSLKLIRIPRILTM
jgi:hypothetical protein